MVPSSSAQGISSPSEIKMVKKASTQLQKNELPKLIKILNWIDWSVHDPDVAGLKVKIRNTRYLNSGRALVESNFIKLKEVLAESISKIGPGDTIKLTIGKENDGNRIVAKKMIKHFKKIGLKRVYINAFQREAGRTNPVGRVGSPAYLNYDIIISGVY